MMTGHHIAGPLTWIVAAYTRTNQCIASSFQFNEFSTIFLNIRAFVLSSGYESDGTVATIAGLLFFLSFFVVRVVPLPLWIYYWVTSDYAIYLKKNGLVLAILQTIVNLFHVIMQCFWFCLMLNKLMKVLNKKDKDGEQKKKDN